VRDQIVPARQTFFEQASQTFFEQAAWIVWLQAEGEKAFKE
jgi:hypothetical protein